MEFVLEKVSIDKKEVLFRLLQYSLFEESETDLNEMNENCLFEYKWFDNYFTDNDRDAYFIKEIATSRILGFVMVNTYTQKFEIGHAIAEFMIIPKYRRRKIGKKVACDIFDKYRGNWEVQPSYRNERAYNFWNSVINEYKNGNCKYEDGIFLFTN